MECLSVMLLSRTVMYQHLLAEQAVLSSNVGIAAARALKISEGTLDGRSACTGCHDLALYLRSGGIVPK